MLSVCMQGRGVSPHRAGRGAVLSVCMQGRGATPHRCEKVLELVLVQLHRGELDGMRALDEERCHEPRQHHLPRVVRLARPRLPVSEEAARLARERHLDERRAHGLVHVGVARPLVDAVKGERGGAALLWAARTVERGELHLAFARRADADRLLTSCGRDADEAARGPLLAHAGLYAAWRTHCARQDEGRWTLTFAVASRQSRRVSGLRWRWQRRLGL